MLVIVQSSLCLATPPIFLVDAEPDLAEQFVEVGNLSELPEQTFDVYASLSTKRQQDLYQRITLSPASTSTQADLENGTCILQMTFPGPVSDQRLHSVVGLNSRTSDNLNNLYFVSLSAFVRSSQTENQAADKMVLSEHLDLGNFFFGSAKTIDLNFRTSNAKLKSYNYFLHRALNIDFGSWVYTEIDDEHSNIQRMINLPPKNTYQLVLTGEDVDKIQSIQIRSHANRTFGSGLFNRERIDRFYSSEQKSARIEADSLTLDAVLSDQNSHEAGEIIIFFKQGRKFLPKPIDIRLRLLPDETVAAEKSRLQRLSRRNNVTDVVRASALSGKIDNIDGGVDHYLDLNASRLEFGFNSTLGTTTLFAASRGACLQPSQIDVSLDLQPYFRRFEQDDALKSLKFGEWNNSGAEDVNDLTARILDIASREMSVDSIYLHPKPTGSTIQHSAGMTKAVIETKPGRSIGVFLSTGIFLTAFLGIISYRRGRMPGPNNAIPRGCTDARDALSARFLKVKRHASGSVSPLLMLAFLMLVVTSLADLKDESLALLIYMVLAIGVHLVSKTEMTGRWVHAAFPASRPSLLVLYCSIVITLVATLAVEPVIGNFISSTLMIALLFYCLDYLLLSDESHAPTQEQERQSAQRDT
jgi:hypothetical protein